MDARRTPRAVVDIRMPGGAVVSFTLLRRQGGALELLPPLAADGGPGVRLHARTWRRLYDLATAAALADPVATERLKRRTMP